MNNLTLGGAAQVLATAAVERKFMSGGPRQAQPDLPDWPRPQEASEYSEAEVPERRHKQPRAENDQDD